MLVKNWKFSWSPSSNTVWTTQANRFGSRPFSRWGDCTSSWNFLVTTNFSVFSHGRLLRSRSIRVICTHATNQLDGRKSHLAGIGWFQPTHMPPPATATSTPYPLNLPQPNPTHGKSGRFHHPRYEPKSVPEPAKTTLYEPKWTLTGGIHPSHTLKRLLLNMEHPQRRYPTIVAQHTGRKIHGGDRIYGTQFPWSDCFEKFNRLHPTVWMNHFEPETSHLWSYPEP